MAAGGTTTGARPGGRAPDRRRHRRYLVGGMPVALRRRMAVVVSVAVAAAVAGAASGGFTPAWSYVPAPVRARLAVKSGGSLYLPARTPLFYRYRSGAAVTNGTLSVTFRNRVRIRQGVWRWTKQSLLWRALPLRSGADCATWSKPDRTLQLGGNRVFWSAGTGGGTAWRCVTDRRGRTFVLGASRGGKLGDVALARVVASGLDVSGRTGVPRVALSATPKTVPRGRSVLVRGLAGSCAAGDTVTVLSRAFPATRTFAGVPAVFAQVGAAGRFSATVRIPAVRRPGSYVLTARCGGGNLGVSAHLAVTR